MSAYRISYYLYRSNPIIWREIKLPSDGTVLDLIASFCLGVGISPVPGKLLDEEEQLISENAILKDVFETDGFVRLTTGRCVICPENKNQEMNSLTFYYEVLNKLEENLQAPEILDGTMFHLPQNVFRVGAINEILHGLGKQESYTLAGVGTYYQGQLCFNKKQTRNLLYSWFIPEKVSMLRTEYAVPLPVVLENKTLYDLEMLADTHNVYAYNRRKADYVVALNRKLSEFDSYYILKQMGIQEYQSFRALVLKGEAVSKNIDELNDIFPTLFHYGMISFTKKLGFMVSSAIMQEYEEWYDQEQEIQFFREKRIASVMSGCRIYYGAFTKKVCKTILDTYYPGEIPEEIVDRVWGESLNGAQLPDIRFMKISEGEDPIAYDYRLFFEKEEPLHLYLKVLSNEYTPRFLPDKTVFESVCQYGIKSLIDECEELWQCIRPHGYRDDDRKDLFIQTLNCLRKGYSVSKTGKIMVDRFHYVWDRKEEVQKELEEILSKILPEIPNILLNGYTAHAAREQNIPRQAEKELNRLMQEEQEAELRAKQEAETRRKAARTTRTTKTTRTTGRRGSRS